jgi:hypothetical protein
MATMVYFIIFFLMSILRPVAAQKCNQSMAMLNYYNHRSAISSKDTAKEIAQACILCPVIVAAMSLLYLITGD